MAPAYSFFWRLVWWLKQMRWMQLDAPQLRWYIDCKYTTFWSLMMLNTHGKLQPILYAPSMGSWASDVSCICCIYIYSIYKDQLQSTHEHAVSEPTRPRESIREAPLLREFLSPLSCRLTLRRGILQKDLALMAGGATTVIECKVKRMELNHQKYINGLFENTIGRDSGSMGIKTWGSDHHLYNWHPSTIVTLNIYIVIWDRFQNGNDGFTPASQQKHYMFFRNARMSPCSHLPLKSMQVTIYRIEVLQRYPGSIYQDPSYALNEANPPAQHTAMFPLEHR